MDQNEQPGQDTILQELVANQLGAPAAPAGGAAAAGGPAYSGPAGQPSPQAGNPSTEQVSATPTEKAVAAGQPAEEGAAAPVTYKVAGRDFTEAQLKGTLDRYAALNHRHATEVAPMKPVLDFAADVLKQAKGKGQDINAEGLVNYLREAAKAYAGGAAAPAAAAPGASDAADGDADDAALSAWEQENAASLPPGYRQTGKRMSKIESMLAETHGMLAKVLQGAQGVQQAATQQLGQAQQHATAAANDRVSAMKQTVLNNLQGVQQKFGFGDSDAQPFLQFAYQRGYTLEDFIDPNLAQTVGQDFMNAQNAPEVQRLRQMAQRRQAFTGNVEGAPGSGAAAAGQQANPDADFFASMVQHAQSNRGY